MPFDAAGFRDDRDGDKPQPAVTTWSGAVLVGVVVLLVVLAVRMMVRLRLGVIDRQDASSRSSATRSCSTSLMPHRL